MLYWYDPMYPQQRFDKPGKSPFMDMMLVPKYADEGGDESGVSISPRVVQNLGVRTAEARPGSLAPKLDAVGNVEYNERAVVLVQARTAGFVEKLHVRAPLDPVREGEPLVEILFPDWAAAQDEYLALKRLAGADVEPLQRAARERLLLARHERGADRRGRARRKRAGRASTLRAPVSGVIAELGAREGMTVAAGTTLFRIAGLGTVWIVAEVPEAQAGLLVPGATVEARVPTYPEEVFSGRVSAILPEVNAATRTRARAHRGRESRGQAEARDVRDARARAGAARAALLVPSEAVIRTGERSVVILAAGEGKFRAVDVEVGAESGGDTEIRKGLEGRRPRRGVGTVPDRLRGEPAHDARAAGRRRRNRRGGPTAAATRAHTRAPAEGVLVSGDDQFLLIKHGPIPSARMGGDDDGVRRAEVGELRRRQAGDRSASSSRSADGEFRRRGSARRSLRRRGGTAAGAAGARHDRRPHPLVDREPVPGADGDACSSPPGASTRCCARRSTRSPTSPTCR